MSQKERADAAIRRKQSAQFEGLLYVLDNQNWLQDVHHTIFFLENVDPKTERLVPYIKENLQAWQENQSNGGLSLNAWMLKRVRDILFPPLNDSEFGLLHIQWVVRTYVNTVKRLYPQRYTADVESKYLLTLKDWEEFEKRAVACFLSDWIRSNKGMRQSIRNFTKKPFGEPRKVKWPDDIENMYERFQQTHAELKVLFDMRLVQIEVEAERASDVDGEIDQILKNISAPEKRLPFTAYSYSPVELCALEFENEKTKRDKLRLLREITRKKNMLTVRKGESEEKNLSNAFYEYYSILDDIEKYGKQYKNEKLSCKRYVASCMWISAMEESNRLYLAASITNYTAQHQWKNGYDIRKKDMEVIGALWGRLPDFDEQIFSKNVEPETGNFKTSAAGDAHNIMRYSKDVEAIFECSEKEIETYVAKQLLFRRELNEVLTILSIVFPLESLPPWTDQNYADAAKFYMEEYNVVKELKKHIFPSVEDYTKQISKSQNRRKKGAFNRYKEVYRCLSSLGGADPINISKIYKKAIGKGL